MTLSNRGGIHGLILLLMTLFLLTTACVEMDIDPEPPYPVQERDYTPPDKPEEQPPWENPGDYPYVTIEEPLDASFVDAGQLAVSGTYAGPELESFTINGRPVGIANGRFATSISVDTTAPLVPILASATTVDGVTSADLVTIFVGGAQEAASQVNNALLLNLENRGLEALSMLLSDLFDGLDISDILGKRLAEAQDKQIDINEAVLGNLELDMAAAGEGLAIKLLADDVVIDLTLLGFYNLVIEVDGLSADLLAEITVNDEYKLSLDILEGEFAVASMDIQGPLIPGIVGDLLTLLAPVLYDLFLEDLIVDELNGLLAGLELNVNIDPAVLSILPSATLTTEHNFGIATDTLLSFTAPWEPAIQPLGFLATPSAPPMFAEEAPYSGEPYGLALALNDDMLNHLLYFLAASGTLEFEITDPALTAEALSLLFFSFENIDPDMALKIEMAPTVAPIFAGGADGMELYFPSYTGRLIVDRGTMGPWEALSFAVNITAPVDILVTDGNTLAFDL
ncbi:MAG: hypothetical protein ACTSXZ_07405, partial [Alphaproteobacteria bacterium]